MPLVSEGKGRRNWQEQQNETQDTDSVHVLVCSRSFLCVTHGAGFFWGVLLTVHLQLDLGPAGLRHVGVGGQAGEL